MNPIPLPKGFSFAAAQAGFKKEGRLDLCLVASDRPAMAAGTLTTNLFAAAPVDACRNILAEGKPVRAFVVNAGQANAGTGEEGAVDCRVAREWAAEAVGAEADEILPASTGVIGQRIKMDKFREALPALKESLGKACLLDAAKAIMTTDTFPKVAWGRVSTDQGEARLAGMAKGSGMICPNMATMLAFVACDAVVDQEQWRQALARAVDRSFNRITVDGDTSTNDCVLAMANGASGVDLTGGEGSDALETALTELLTDLAYMIVQDAEGGTKVIRIIVTGAENDAQAELAARAVGNSPLVKTAFYGQDANWGRILAAAGRSGAVFSPDETSLSFGPVAILDKGRPVPGDMDSLLAPLMRKQDIDVHLSLGSGPGEYVVLASDLTHEYISINADYRT